MLKRHDHRGNRLSKYDAPLRIQFEKGVLSFRKGKVRSPYPLNTMQYREWERGFESAYFANLKRNKKYEARGRGEKVYG
tara:strand:- start:258 stop:494 length:237 start_codon:yes stop_codon:yes gene_type:complete